jgi:hypothetical protein
VLLLYQPGKEHIGPASGMMHCTPPADFKHVAVAHSTLRQHVQAAAPVTSPPGSCSA